MLADFQICTSVPLSVSHNFVALVLNRQRLNVAASFMYEDVALFNLYKYFSIDKHFWFFTKMYLGYKFRIPLSI